MKLNMECTKDIMLTIEDVVDSYTAFEIRIESFTQYEKLKKYSYNEIYYHLNQCKASGFFDENSFTTFDKNFVVFALSPQGHDFAENARNDTVWKKALGVFSKLGSFSLSVAGQILAELIKAEALQISGITGV